MSGGTGDDTYVVDNAGDTITEPTSFVLPAGWTLRGTADFNNDGRLDVVVTNSAVGEIWLLNGSTVTSTDSFPGSGYEDGQTGTSPESQISTVMATRI